MRIEARSLAESIAEHAEYLSSLTRDENVSEEVIRAEALGRAYLIEARVLRLRAAVSTCGSAVRFTLSGSPTGVHHMRPLRGDGDAA